MELEMQETSKTKIVKSFTRIRYANIYFENGEYSIGCVYNTKEQAEENAGDVSLLVAGAKVAVCFEVEEK